MFVKRAPLSATCLLYTSRIETVDEPGAVAMGIRQLRQHLPGALGHRWRERDRKKRAGEDADRLAGRLRYASVQAVDTAARAWARDIDSGWRALSDSLGSAVIRAEQAAGSSTCLLYTSRCV